VTDYTHLNQTKPTRAQIPQGSDPNNHAFLWRLPPQWEQPDFYTTPYDAEQNPCLPAYATPTWVFNDAVPGTAIITILGVSYQFDQDAAVGDRFTVELVRNRDILCAWVDVVTSTTGDRGARFAFSSNFRPFPVRARFDRNDEIHVRVTYHGPFPYTKTALDVLNYNIRITLHGYMSRINTNGDGQALKTSERRIPLTRMPAGKVSIPRAIRRLAELARG
jgi:hypothetical protein